MGDVGSGGARLRAFARREWGPLLGPVREELTRRKWRAVPLALGATLLTLACHLWQRFGDPEVLDRIGTVYADLSWQEMLLRTPLSLFVPALGLPVWGALVQLLVVFGIAEIHLGVWRTLALAYACTLAGTLYARYGAAVGPDGFLGLPPETFEVPDTGPSAAVISLALYVCWRCRAWWTGAVVIVAMVVEFAVEPNLAGREHLAALVLAVLLWAAAEVRAATGGRSRGRPTGNGRTAD